MWNANILMIEDDADILLLDEPFGVLDVITRGEMQDWLYEQGKMDSCLRLPLTDAHAHIGRMEEIEERIHRQIPTMVSAGNPQEADHLLIETDSIYIGRSSGKYAWGGG